jgi:2-phosphoglycolate phosphatase
VTDAERSSRRRPRTLDPALVRGLIFDLDGTLIDSYAAIAASLNQARAAFDLSALADDQVRRKVGHGLERLIAELVGPNRIEEGVRIFHDHYAEVFSAMTDLLPGVREALAELSRRGYRMSVASNKPARFGRRILEELGLERLFDVVHGPDSVGRPKPDPAMLRACLQSMDRPAGDSVYVGDMPLDVESACNADVPVVLVAGGSSSREELLATGEAVISTFRELPMLLSPR